MTKECNNLGLRLNKNGILAATAVILIAGATNAGQYYMWDKNTEELTLEYEDQIYLMQQTLDEIGPLTDVYTVLEEGKQGLEVKQEDLALIQMPESLVGSSYILDPETVVGKYYKVNITHGVPITEDLLMQENIDDTSREYDIVADVWPVGLKRGDYVDVEIIYPNGEKYIVMAKKRVESITGQSVKTFMNGTERYLYQAALVDYYLGMADGAQLRFTKYMQPGVQKTAQVYYAIPKNVITVMNMDPNIIEKANSALEESRRSIIENSMQYIAQDKEKDTPKDWATGIQSVNSKLVEAYEEYLSTYGLETYEPTGDVSNEIPVEDFLNEEVQDIAPDDLTDEEGVAE